MTQQPFRLPSGGSIDRSNALNFVFDGINCTGYVGDTIASALLANGLRVVGRSLRRGRPRGVFGLGREDSGASTPLAQTFGRRTDAIARDFFSMTGERLLSSGEIARPSRASSEKQCDVAVIGGGAAGLTAALVASNAGANVILVENDCQLGGWLVNERRSIGRMPGHRWVHELAQIVRASPNIEVLCDSTAFEPNDLWLLPVKTAAHPACEARWLNLRATQFIAATGAVERPLPFQDNDRPGIMLAGAVRGYLNRYAVSCGSRVIVTTNNDGAYLTAFDLSDAGVEVAAILDVRTPNPSYILDEAEYRGLPVIPNSYVEAIYYRGAIEAVDVAELDGRHLAMVNCDCIAMSGGLAITGLSETPLGDSSLPSRSIHSSNATLAAAGSCAGAFSLLSCLSSAAKAGAEAAIAAGYNPREPWTGPYADPLLNTQRVGASTSAPRGNLKRVCVDFGRDFTAYDTAASASWSPTAFDCLLDLSGELELRGDAAGSQSLYNPLALGMLTRPLE